MILKSFALIIDPFNPRKSGVNRRVMLNIGVEVISRRLYGREFSQISADLEIFTLDWNFYFLLELSVEA
jgi:hypothetical protein